MARTPSPSPSVLRRAGAPIATLAALALLCVACDSGERSAGEPVARSEGTTTTAPGTTTAEDTVVLPVTVADVGSTPRVTTTITVGTDTLTVLVDTGSSGIILAPDATSGFTPSDTTSSADLAAGTLTLLEGTATVAVGGVSAGSIGVTVAQELTCASGATDCDSSAAIEDLMSGTDGVLGIGLSDDDTSDTTVFSPFLQLPAPYDQGVTIDLAGDRPSITLGPVDVPSDATTAPFTPMSPPTYPTGAPAFLKDATMCWTVGSANGCGLTDFDTGNPVTAFASGALPDLPADGPLASGTSVALAGDGSSDPVWSFTTGDEEGVDLAEVIPTLPPPTRFNTGIAFFRSNVLAFDLAGQRFVISPAG